jgi:SAM-dependent methyltransferase
MKTLIKKLIPDSVFVFLHEAKITQEKRRNARKTVQEVFTDIYQNKKWGGKRKQFFSGDGSTEDVIQPYVQSIIDFLKTEAVDRPKVIDLGCGDFEVGKHLIPYCSAYIGVDIVPTLIERHQCSGYGDHVTFSCMNIIDDPLPSGDICILRQVLQHLANAEIAKIVPKLEQYKVVFITEHYPSDNPQIVPNKDMVHGSGMRLYANSGVYLNHPPFNVPAQALELVLEVPGRGAAKGYDPGVIRTYQLTW